jgi:hypothetical protein
MHGESTRVENCAIVKIIELRCNCLRGGELEIQIGTDIRLEC